MDLKNLEDKNNMPSDNNKRIAKNTMYLYLRMLVVMAVSLFTVRVVLNALGAEDYGINNVVGGVVTMFSFLTSTMISASQRFFAFYLGQKDYKKLADYFSMSFWCYLGLIVIVFILAETLGLWFVKTQLTIPEERMGAAMWVYQCSIVSFSFSILTIPFNSMIIAREKMNIYAIGGLLEVFLKLGVAYLIFISPFDKLKAYAVLLSLMMSSTNVFYILYGYKKFSECHVKKIWDVIIFKDVVNYSGWSLFGAIAGVFRSQGINILLNMFFNPVVNAARAIAYQVNNALNLFVTNFYKAVQPQITKYYAAGDQDNMMTLVFRSSRFCFYLIFLLSLPILLETPFILSTWLKTVPENTVLFTRLVILTAIVDSTSYPLQSSISATGRIKYFQIVTGGLLILNLPIAWFFLNMGYPPEVTMYIAITISCIAQITRILFSKHYNNMSVRAYLKNVVLPIIAVIVTSMVVPLFLWIRMEEGMLRMLVVGIASIMFSGVCIMLLGVTKPERTIFINIVKNKTPWKKK